MRISDWSSDVCSSDLDHAKTAGADLADLERALGDAAVVEAEDAVDPAESVGGEQAARRKIAPRFPVARDAHRQQYRIIAKAREPVRRPAEAGRSEEHTSELQSLMSISYAVFCLKKKKTT